MNQDDAHGRQVKTQPGLLQRRGVHRTIGGVGVPVDDSRCGGCSWVRAEASLFS